MTDRIALSTIEFQARHGATAAERKTQRRFQVDVEIEYSLAAAVRSDRLADAVDYHEVCTMVVELGTARTFRLIEALAGSIAEALAARWSGAVFTVEVRKLNPPCPGNPVWASARVRRGAE